MNPVTISQYVEYLLAWAQKNPFYKQVFEPRPRQFTNHNYYKIAKFFDEDLPTKAMQSFAKLPIVGSKALLEQAN